MLLFLVSFMGFTLSLMKADASCFINEDKEKNVLDYHKSKEAWEVNVSRCMLYFYMFSCLLCKN